MDEHGMENEHLEQQRFSSNTEYQPTKCRVTKPPPPKPATNPLQFIKVPPPPLFQKVKEQVSKVEEVKKERKEIQDEAEDWQANLDNWKSSRRKLQGHIIERVVEVKKFEQEDNGRSHRKSKTFNEILEERGKSKYTIPIYLDESDDWSDLGISDSKSNNHSHEKKTETNEQNSLGASDSSHSNGDNIKHEQPANSFTEYNLNLTKNDVNLNNNDYTHVQPDAKPNSVPKNGQYTYEGAIEGYRSTIKSRIDHSVLVKFSDMPKRNSEVEALVPKGEIVKRKELIVKQQEDIANQPNTANRVLQDFENSISIKQRMKNLEKCNDQTVKYVDNINIKPKVKQISQFFNKPCTEPVKTNDGIEVRQTEYPNAKINIDIVPWVERENTSDTSEIDIYMDKNDPKEVESQSDDKSSDTFYSGLEDTNYPPSVSSTDYMALSSDREDSGIHTADVSCSVSQTDDIAEELESNANSQEASSDDFQPRSFKGNNVYGNHILELTKENVIQQTNKELREDDKSQYKSTIITSFTKDNICDSPTENAAQTIENLSFTSNDLKDYQKEAENNTDTSDNPVNLPEIKDEILKVVDPLTHLNESNYVFDSDFSLLPTKMVEPPKVKPPPPPVVDEVKRMNSTKRIKKEITLKRSNFLGLNPSDVENFEKDDVLTSPDQHKDIVVAKNAGDSMKDRKWEGEVKDIKNEGSDDQNSSDLQLKGGPSCEVDEITKREQEIIEMVEKAEKCRDSNGNSEGVYPVQDLKPPLPASRTLSPKTSVQKVPEGSYYDKEAELRRLQEKNYSCWQQQPKLSESSIPNIIQREPLTPTHGSSKSTIRKLTTVNNDVQPYLEHHPPVGPPPLVNQTRPSGESQNRILSVSGKKKCSSCGNELGRGAAMIIETLCLFYHMECFKCCVCNVQLGNGLNGTDVRVRNQKLHCHNCYSSDDGVKFSCV